MSRKATSKSNARPTASAAASATSNAVGKKAQTRERILKAASKSVRRSGFRGVGVADVMKEAGLTHGGFYAHFPSRDALLAEAIIQASTDIADVIRANIDLLTRRGLSPFRAFIETYLSDSQISDRENGCPVAALCGAMSSLGPALRDPSRTTIENLQKLVKSAMPKGSSTNAIWSVTSSVIGAMQLARALGDNKSGRAVLTSARTELLAHYDNPN